MNEYNITLGAVCNFHLRPNKKICVSGYMLLKIKVGRSDNFFIF